MREQPTAILSRLKQKIDLRLNNHLVDMKEGWDNSITGFNDAWDIVRALIDEELARAALPRETT